MAKHFTLMCTWIFKFNDMWNAILLYFHIVNEIFDVRLPFILIQRVSKIKIPVVSENNRKY